MKRRSFSPFSHPAFAASAFALALAALLPACADEGGTPAPPVDESTREAVDAEAQGETQAYSKPIVIGTNCQNVFNGCMISGGCTLNPYTGGWGTCPSGVQTNCLSKAVACQFAEDLEL